jgi:transposase
MAHHLSTEERWNIVAECCLHSDMSLKLTRIAIDEVSSSFGVSTTTVQREWKSFRDQRKKELPGQPTSLDHVKHAGGSTSNLNQVEFEAIHAITDENDGYMSVRDILINLQETFTINISHGALERHLKLLGSHYITSRALPHLTEAQMMARLKFCVDRIVISDEGHLIFTPFKNTLWLDEKWFDMFEKSMLQLLLTGSSEFPKRHPDKNALQKVMFVAFLGQPGSKIDGKYGMWAFTDQQPAQRRSKRREAGTMETKCVSVTADVFYDKCIEPG